MITGKAVLKDLRTNGVSFRRDIYIGLEVDDPYLGTSTIVNIELDAWGNYTAEIKSKEEKISKSLSFKKLNFVEWPPLPSY
jgi:hypothetical protein